MLTSNDKALIGQARLLSQQARDPAPHYEHSTIGYNYRMSNILAAIGRGQLRVLDDRVKARRRIFAYYKEALGNIPGIEFMPEAPYGRSNCWLTVILITPEEFGRDREFVQQALEEENIEARPVWPPAPLPARRAYRPEGRAYASERSRCIRNPYLIHRLRRLHRLMGRKRDIKQGLSGARWPRIYSIVVFARPASRGLSRGGQACLQEQR